MTDLLVWLRICGSKKAKVQVSHYVYKTLFTNLYDIQYANYWPSSNERSEDWAANNRLAMAKVYLIFLIWKAFKAPGKKIAILEAFVAPLTLMYKKPWKYNELEYCINMTELQMEFYLRIMEMFCKPGSMVFPAFGGGKVVCAGW
jgi:hypothetical protein